MTRLPNELERKLEVQLSDHLQVQLGEDIFIDTGDSEGVLRKYELAYGLLGSAQESLHQAVKQLDKERGIAEKYHGLCHMVRGLLGNYRRLVSENHTTQERVKRLSATVAQQKKEISDLNRQIETLQETVRTQNSIQGTVRQSETEELPRNQVEALIQNVLTQIEKVRSENEHERRMSEPRPRKDSHAELLEGIDRVLDELHEDDAANENRIAA